MKLTIGSFIKFLTTNYYPISGSSLYFNDNEISKLDLIEELKVLDPQSSINWVFDGQYNMNIKL